MNRATALAGALLAVATTACDSPTRPEPLPELYSVTAIPALRWAGGLNEAGHVAGTWVRDPGSETSPTAAAIWDGTMLRKLTDPQTVPVATAVAINELGLVVGNVNTADGPRVAFWKDGTTAMLPGFGSAYGMNDRGDAAGVVVDTLVGTRAVAWLDRRPVDLGTGNGSRAMDVDNSRRVVGYMARGTGSGFDAFVWENGQAARLSGGGAPAMALRINERGQIAGIRTMTDGSRRLALWKPEGLWDLGAPDSIGGALSVRDLTDAGQIVGHYMHVSGESRAYVWQDGTFVDLDRRIDPSLGMRLFAAIDMNAKGQILALARVAVGEIEMLQVVLLTPK